MCKSNLFEMCQKYKLAPPRFIDHRDNPKEPWISYLTLSFGNFSGVGRSKREAQNQASNTAILFYETNILSNGSNAEKKEEIQIQTQQVNNYIPTAVFVDQENCPKFLNDVQNIHSIKNLTSIYYYIFSEKHSSTNKLIPEFFYNDTKAIHIQTHNGHKNSADCALMVTIGMTISSPTTNYVRYIIVSRDKFSWATKAFLEQIGGITVHVISTIDEFVQINKK